jgi:PAS domain S-box-containing protein
MRPNRSSLSRVDVAHFHWPVRYGAAVCFVFLALLLNFLPPARSLPFLFFFGAVTLSARCCGFGPIFATVLSAIAADYFFMPPQFAFSLGPSDLLRVLFFVVVSLLIGSIAKQRSRAEKIAEEDRAHLAAVVEYSDDAIYTKTLDGIITQWNDGAQKLYGYAPEEILGRNVAQLAPPERQDEVVGIMATLRRGERVEHYETERVRKDGSKITVSLSVSPLFDAEGKIAGASSIARDITTRKLNEEALRRAEKLAAAGRLSATIAHELNNPLETVTNLLYLVRNNPSLDSRGLKHLELANHELARVAHMAKQTLGFYRDSLAPVSTDVSQVMDEVLGLYMRKLESKGIEVQKRYLSPKRVNVFPGEIRQVFSNLVANAIDAMIDSGCITVKITNSHEWKNGHVAGVRTTVVDSGSGISPEHRRQLFEPFYTTKKDVGTGLGLWLSKEIVQKHGGSISVRSSIQPGRSGTLFSVFIPSQRPAESESEAA